MNDYREEIVVAIRASFAYGWDLKKLKREIQDIWKRNEEEICPNEGTQSIEKS